MKLRSTILSCIAFVMLGASGQTISKPTPFMYLMGLNSPVKSFRQWDISAEILAGNPGINFADPAQVEKAIDDEILDEMSVSMPTYTFSADDWSPKVLWKGNITEGFPGIFNITYVAGKPAIFILDDKDLQERIDKGEIWLDSYDMGLQGFNINYDSNGMPACLIGVRMGFFGGGDYQIVYSDYKFDDKGNWTRRKKSTPYDTLIQYRVYEY